MPKAKDVPGVGSRVLLAKTCVECRKFKQASEYGRVFKYHSLADGTRRKYVHWRPECRECFQNRYRDGEFPSRSINYDKPVNDASQEFAVRRYYLWTDEDIKTLERLDKEGLKSVEIAKQMGRSVHSIYTKRNKIKE